MYALITRETLKVLILIQQVYVYSAEKPETFV